MNLCYKKVFRSVLLLVLVIYLTQINANSQIEKNIQADSIERDTINKTKIFVSKSDTTNFVPIDSVKFTDFSKSFLIPKKRNPGRAALYSLILPGLGQAYNGKYWKIPIIYGLFAGMYYLYDNNNFKYNLFKKAYKNYDADAGVTTPGIDPRISDEQLKKNRDRFKRDRDYNVILGVVIFIFNILDANVDAHLMDFDVSEDLSLKITPEINNYSNLQLNLNDNSLKNTFGLKFVISMHRKK